MGSVSDGNVPDAYNILYNPDIPTPSTGTSGIEPVIKTVEEDGTHRYFDLLEHGIYIDNGKKAIAK